MQIFIAINVTLKHQPRVSPDNITGSCTKQWHRNLIGMPSQKTKPLSIPCRWLLTSTKQIGKVNLWIFLTSFCTDINDIMRTKAEQNEFLSMHAD